MALSGVFDCDARRLSGVFDCDALTLSLRVVLVRAFSSSLRLELSDLVVVEDDLSLPVADEVSSRLYLELDLEEE